MSTIATLAVAVTANANAFKNNMASGKGSLMDFAGGAAEARRALLEAVPASERLEAGLDSLAKMAAKGKITVDQMTEAGAKLKEKFEGESLGTKFFGGFVEESSHMLEHIVAWDFAFEGARKIIETVKAAFEQVGEIGRGSVRYGVSVEDFSRMTFAADAAHISVESLGRSMGFLEDAVAKAAEGTDKQAIEVFKNLGLDIAQLRAEDPAKMFLDVAAAISNVANASDRVRDLKAIFGRQGLELAPLINQGAGVQSLFNESDAAGFTRTEEQVKKAEEAESAAAKAWDTLRGTFMDLASHNPVFDSSDVKIISDWIIQHGATEREYGKVANDHFAKFQDARLMEQNSLDALAGPNDVDELAERMKIVKALTDEYAALQNQMAMAQRGGQHALEGFAAHNLSEVSARLLRAKKEVDFAREKAEDNYVPSSKEDEAPLRITQTVAEMKQLVETYGKGRDALALYRAQMEGADAKTLAYLHTRRALRMRQSSEVRNNVQ